MAKLTVIFAILFLSGCAPPPGGFARGPEENARAAEATLNAAHYAIDETRAAQAQQTAVAARSTAEAQIEQTAVADKATRSMRSTEESMVIEQTAVALQMSIDEATRIAEARETAVAVTIAAEEFREMQRAENVVMLRTAEADRRESNLFWADIRNGLFAALIGVAIIVLLMVGLAIVARVRNLNRNPVQQFRDVDRNVNILIVPRGLFGSEVRQIGRPGPVASAHAADPDPVIMLPAPIRELAPIPIGHVLIAGGSGSGKSTAMRSIIGQRRGEVVVVDPHAAPGEWDASTVIGMGGNFDAIEKYFEWMREELYRRMGARGRGDQMIFPELTVATDELPAIVSELGKDKAVGAWRSWVQQGRKFDLFVIVSSQSTRVKTLGIAGEGDLRDQFSAIVSLGSEAERKFPNLVRGMGTRKAVVEMEGSAARAIVIPNVPPFAAQQRPGPVASADPAVEGVNAPGIDTDSGFVPADEVEKIIHYGKILSSLRAVSMAVYSSHGGQGFYKSRAVLERHGITPG